MWRVNVREIRKRIRKKKEIGRRGILRNRREEREINIIINVKDIVKGRREMGTVVSTRLYCGQAILPTNSL